MINISASNDDLINESESRHQFGNYKKELFVSPIATDSVRLSLLKKSYLNVAFFVSSSINMILKPTSDLNNNQNSNVNINREFCTYQKKTSQLLKINQQNDKHDYSHSNFPLSSSPAPLRKSGTFLFDFDQSLKDPKSIKNALSINISKSDESDDISDSLVGLKLNEHTDNELAEDEKRDQSLSLLKKSQFSFSNRILANNAAISNKKCLLGSFEESLLNGRMNPLGVVDGFYAEIGASGSFFPDHVTLPVHAAFYQVSDDIAASPYLGTINLASLGSKRGYRVPNKGTVQVTLFNPNKNVLKMFVVMYDLNDMPKNHCTFIRQRTMYVPSSSSSSSDDANKMHNIKQSEPENSNSIQLKSYLRYLIHLKFATSKSGKMYLHTDIKLIFARNKSEIDPRLGQYEYKTFTELPKNPRYSAKR